MTATASRRSFLRAMSALAARGVIRPVALNLAAVAAASAQGATDYRALVCLYMGGGNDHLSMVAPYDTASYAAYAAARGGLALASGDLLPIADPVGHGGLALGFSPMMTNIKAIHDAGRAIVLAGVGTLIGPTTKAAIQAGTATLPSLLGSHADQQNTWMSLATASNDGWAGRIGDILAAGNGRAAFTTVSATGGSTLMLSGRSSSPFTVSGYGGPDLFFDPGSPFDHATTRPAARRNLLEQAVATTYASLRDNATALNAAILPPDGLGAVPAYNDVAQQLQTVARIVGGGGALGVTRQVFFVELDGFDTHDGQVTRHPLLMQQLDQAIGYFDGALGQIGARGNVTLMTLSEFGRQLLPNNDGTDHGWGAHHLVVGGAVSGGIRGTIPVIAPDGPDFLGGGQMIPTTSVEQYGATLARWMGLSDAQVLDIFPRLANWSTTDLGFFS